MRIRYDFPNIKSLRKLRLDVELRDGLLVPEVRGPFSFLFRWIFSGFFNVYNEVGPVGSVNGASVYSLYVPPIPSPMHSRHVEDFLRRWLFRKRIPLAVTIAVTDKCQCRCVHCSVVTNGSRSNSLMSLEEIQRIVRESVDLGVTNVTFTGGEPLLRSDLEAMISAVPQDKAVALVFTNGIGLSPERARSLKAAGAAGIQISLDSPQKEEHDRLRVWPGCFEAVENGIKAAREAGLLVGLSTYATNDFVGKGKLTKMAALGDAWGVNELTVFDAIATGRLMKHEEVTLTSESRSRLIQEAMELRQKYHAKMHVITQSWTNSKSGFARFIGCLAGHYQFHIAANGEFRPCDFTPLAIGDARSEPIADLWKKLTTHPAYRRHRHDCRMQCPSFRKKYIEPRHGTSMILSPGNKADA